jgi:polysaccharide export outer membrane protein
VRNLFTTADFSKLASRMFAGALLFALAACASTRGGPIAYDQGTFQAPDPPKVAALESGYRIAPMDTVAVKVFRMPDLSGDYQVDLTGQISMPLIGEVRAVDMTTAQLDDSLTKKLGEKYLENPDISVGIKDSARRNITVDGAVKNAGAFPAAGETSLMQAIAQAGGVNEEANARRIAVFRTIGGQRQAAAFDLVSIRRGEMPDPKIYPGDIIVVDGNGVKAAYRQILNSFPILSIFRPF